MKKFIKIVSLICVIAMLAGCGLVSKVEEPKNENEASNSPTVVTVGGVDYSLERFNLYFYNAQDEILKANDYQQASSIPDDFWTKEIDGKTTLELAKETALASLIDDAIAYQKAKDYGIELTSEEKSAITNQMASLRQDKVSIAQFDYIGISVEELEKYYNEAFHLQHLLPKLVDEGEIKVDAKEVKSAFESQYVKAKHILISTVDSATQQPLSADKIAQAEAKAQKILDDIKGGADFDELMNANSEDPGLATAPDGYVFTTGEMVPEFEESAFSLAEDEVSGLVKTDYGIHILKRVPFDMSGSQELSAMENIESQLASPELETLLKTWKAETDIKTYDDVIAKLEPTITNNQE